MTAGIQALATVAGTENVNVDPGGAVLAQVIVGQLRDCSGYLKSVAVTAFSIQVGNNTSVVALNPAGTLATGTITFPQKPSDGQRLLIFSSQTQTALTLTAGSGQTINNGVTALTANVAVEYLYSASNTTWDRIS